MNSHSELLGFPCSGKSTYCKTIQDVYFASKRSIVFRLLTPLVLFLHPLLFFKVLYTLRLAEIKNIKRQLLSILRFYVRLIEIKFKSHGKVIDEGLLQALWGVFYDIEFNNSNSILFRTIAVSLISRIDVVYYLSVDEKILKIRNECRLEKTRFSYDISHMPLYKINAYKYMKELLLISTNHKKLNKVYNNDSSVYHHTDL